MEKIYNHLEENAKIYSACPQGVSCSHTRDTTILTFERINRNMSDESIELVGRIFILIPLPMAAYSNSNWNISERQQRKEQRFTGSLSLPQLELSRYSISLHRLLRL